MRRLIAPVAPTLALLIALAGCTPAPPAVESSSPPSARPTATARAETTPEPRLSVTCDALVDADALATAFGVEGSPRTPEPPTGSIVDTFAGRGELAVRQEGALLCEWGEAAGADPALVVQVLPDVADLASLGDVVEPSPVADDARELCGERRLRFDCAFWIPLASTTTVVALTGDAALAADLVAFRALARETAGGIARAADAATIMPAWQPKPTALTLPTTCGELIEESSRLGSLGALTADATAGQLVDPLALTAVATIGGLSCAWSGQDGGTLDVLLMPGAAWAWDDFAPRSTDLLDFTPRADLGEAAALASQGGDHLLDVRAGGAWLSIRADTSSPEALVDLARALLDIIGADD